MPPAPALSPLPVHLTVVTDGDVTALDDVVRRLQVCSATLDHGRRALGRASAAAAWRGRGAAAAQQQLHQAVAGLARAGVQADGAAAVVAGVRARVAAEAQHLAAVERLVVDALLRRSEIPHDALAALAGLAAMGGFDGPCLRLPFRLTDLHLDGRPWDLLHLTGLPVGAAAAGGVGSVVLTLPRAGATAWHAVHRLAGTLGLLP